MDRRSFLVSIPALVLCLGVLGSTAEAKPKEKKVKVVVYCVAQTGPEAFESLPAADVKKRKKELAKEHKEAVKAWTASKKAAKKAKEKFSEPKPKAKPLKVIAKGFKGQEAADAHIAKVLEEIRKAKEKRDAKKGAKQQKKKS